MRLALDLCEYGRQFGHEDSILKLLCEADDKMGAAMNGKLHGSPFCRCEFDYNYSPEEIEALGKRVKTYEDAITSIFLDAVRNHDGEAIMRLAQGVWFFKDKRLHNRVPADRERGILITLKGMLEMTGEKIPIRTLAEFLAIEAKANGRKFQPEADGYSALRRKCKELNFPLAESRQTRRKKGV